MNREQKFFNALRDVFVGAKVEGESGYINLMRIKSRYYEKGVFPRLQQDINEALKPFPAFRDELFEKLYDFFHRYFSESGSIYFRYTPLHQNVYEKVYTDDKDVMLFWKTHMLYYVKTDRLFRSLEVEVDGTKFYFDVSTLEHKKSNEKRNIVYSFKEKRKDGTLVFGVAYSEKGKKTKTDEILKTLRKGGNNINEDLLDRAFRVFERQSEVDYFINKDAKAFLEEQFNLWLYQYVFSGVSEWTEVRIKQLQTLKDIAYKIIAFISQFENELVNIWNKPKFVLNSNYVITLDRIAGKDIKLVEKLLAHKNFKAQMEEWQQLGIVEDSFKKSAVLEKDLMGKHLAKPYQHLPIDTKHFKDLELEILGLFDNLDQELDGWLIKSENYQALNTILRKFQDCVQTTYIDPPFNKEQEADYYYSVKYKDATWISILENRISRSKTCLTDSGAFFLRCDYNGNMFARILLNEVFGSDAFTNQLSIRRVKKNVTGQGRVPMPDALDNVFVYFMPRSEYADIFREKFRKGYWRRMDDSAGVRKPPERIIFGRTFDPPEGRHFKFNQKKIDNMLGEGRIRLKCKTNSCDYVHTEGKWSGCPDCKGNDPLPEYFVGEAKKEVLDTNWTDIYGYAFDWDFPTENSEKLLYRIIKSASKDRDFVFDFFLGSGTSTAVAHKCNRRWLGVEMGEHWVRMTLVDTKVEVKY
jgi:adenine-specific DNA-methyltransferase